MSAPVAANVAIFAVGLAVGWAMRWAYRRRYWDTMALAALVWGLLVALVVVLGRS